MIFLLASRVAAQKKTPFNFVITTWNEDNGLPQNSVNDIVQTKDGYLWIATYGGLARFNGISFKVFNTFNSPGLSSNRILSLFNDKEGRLWISSEQGLSYYYKGIFKSFTEKDGFKIVSSLGVKQDKNGTIWILTYPGFYQYRNGKFIKQQVTKDENLRKRAMAGDADFFVPFRNQLYAVIDNKVVFCRTVSKYPYIQFLNVVENPKGSLWLGTTSNHLLNIKNGKIKQYKIENKLVANNINDLFIDSDGRLWIGDSKGLTILKDNKFYKITSKNGIPNTGIHKIFQDNEGNFWIGTNSGGLCRIRRTIISNYGKSSGLLNNRILSLDLNKDGHLFIGTNGGGIYELRNNKIRFSKLNKYFTQKYIWSLFEDSQKRYWSNNHKLYYVHNNKKIFIPASNKYDLYNIYAIYEAKDGAIWLGYQFELLRYFNNKFKHYLTKHSSSNADVRCIMEDKKGNIWAGAVNGLYEIIRGKVKSYTSIPGLRSYYFRAIHQDKDGVMWFGTYGGGLIRLKNNKFFVFSTENGLQSNVISQIVEDDNGYFWMGSNHGIQRISKKELNDFADGKINSFFVYNYDKSDGMISSETNGGFQPSAVKDKNGNIYFPTIKGITVVHTKELIKNKLIPPVHIGRVFVNGKERKINNQQINYDSSNVEIYFDILSYTLPHKNHAKYIMEGYDKGWNNAGDLRYARYTNLPPGKYTFKVIGSNADNVWNNHAASISITVLPPFWMTWWFRTILVLMILSIGPIIYFRKVRAFKYEQNLQHEFSGKLIKSQETERSRIAQELHDSLGQELLLIKNRALLGLKNRNGDSKMRQQLEYISQYADGAIKQVRQISHNLRPPELDRLGITETMNSIISEIENLSLIKIESKINDIDGIIPKEKEINLIRILQEALGNILKHSNADVISINLLNSQNKILLLIKDNGKGFSTEDNPENHSKGLGLDGMIERAKILGGLLKIYSSPGKGTILTLEIPIKNV